MIDRSQHRPPGWRAAAALAALALAACSASLPSVGSLGDGAGAPTGAGSPAPAVAADGPGQAMAGAVGSAPRSGSPVALPASPPASSVGGLQSGAPRAPSGDTVIVGFRAATVILYTSESSNDGERVAANALPLPLRTRVAASNAGRVEVMTVYGPRWISRSEATFAPAAN